MQDPQSANDTARNRNGVPSAPTAAPLWRRRSEREVEADRRRRRRLDALELLIGAVIFGACLAAGRLLIGDPRHRRPPYTLGRAAAEGLAVVVLAFVALCVRKAVFGEGRTRLTLCTQCYDVQVAGPSDECPCGKLEDADLWTRDRRTA